MGIGYTVVAIPARNDYIWKISSEKVPHLTLLFLGEKLENLDSVKVFLMHAVNLSLRGSFVLDVERRGVLGDQSADVLFFANNKYNVGMLQDFRSHLLTNPDIRNGYDSVEQFPTWIPHLTLGYPETPAKVDKSHLIESVPVYFNRIALWTGDYEGVEFPLNDNSSDPIAMSARGEAFIKHYGVKGMRWGVRRDNPSGGSLPASEDSQRASAAQDKARAGGTRALSNRELQDLVNRMNLEQQYSRLQGSQPTAFDKGKKFINNATFIGQTLNSAIAFAKSPAGQLIRKGLIGV